MPDPYYQTAGICLYRGDCLAVLAELPEASVDAVVTDPPYDLVSIQKRFGKPGSSPCQYGTDGAFARAAKGFMGKQWDGTGIASRPETWAAVLRVLKPGGHLLAFGGTRTNHRMVCAIEDAEFEIRDSLMWLYATGFPKSHNLDGEWEGWGTALKPAHEPIILARKPLSEKSIAANVERWGTGALNIDATRIARTEGDVPGWHKSGANGTDGYLGTETFRAREMSAEEIRERCGGGRWPANVVLSCDCPSAPCLPGCPVAELDRQSGVLHTHPGTARRDYQTGIYGPSRKSGMVISVADSGGASRFFFVAKPTRDERDAGCRALSVGTVHRAGHGNNENDPVTQRFITKARNTHPTCKPVTLMRYLVRLITPPGGTVLDPFMGSGTTGVACVQEGFSFVGIDAEGEYCEIARERIRHTPKPLPFEDPQPIAKPVRETTLAFDFDNE